MKKLIFLLLTFILVLPAFSLANGGDQRVIEGKYLINLSRAPFTPRAGGKVAMLVSFVDIQKNKLIQEDLIVKIRIAKLGGADNRTFLFEKDNIKVDGGVLELPYTFTEPGLHEIFFDFAFASNPQQVYEAPDFLMDVQPITQDPNRFLLFGGIIGGLLGLIVGWVIGRRAKITL
jgi:hypothetical protein